MRIQRWKTLVTASLTAIMLFQSSPAGLITAYAAEEGISLAPTGDDLKSELAAKAKEFPAGAFAFYKQAATVAEGAGDQEIKVVRWGDASQAATVDVKAMDLTAVWGEDYTVYYKDGLNKVELQPAQTEEEAAAEEAAKAKAEEEAAAAQAEAQAAAEQETETTSALRSAYTKQTGEETVNTDWRGQAESYLGPVAAVEAAGAIAENLPGTATQLSFAEGEYEKTLYVHVNDDDKAESEEAFKLILGAPSAGILGEGFQCNVTVTDNEQAEDIVFGMKDAEVVTEAGATAATVTVERTSGLDYYAGAVIRTRSGSATSTDSYTAANGATVPFLPGETEKTVEIPLTEGYQTGTYFDVMLDADSVNVEKGREESRVWLGEVGEVLPVSDETVTTDEAVQQAADDAEAAAAAAEEEAAAEEATTNEQADDEVPATDDAAAGDETGDATPEADAAAPAEVPTAEEEDAAKGDPSDSIPALKPADPSNQAAPSANSRSAAPADNSVMAAATTQDGVVYDTKEINTNKFNADVNTWKLDQSASATKSFNLREATKATATTSLSGKKKHWIFGTAYGKNATMYVDGREVVYHDGDGQDLNNYTDTFNLDYAQSQSGTIKLHTNTDGTNNDAYFVLHGLKVYYPRYTVKLDTSAAKKNLKGRNYTSTKDYKEFDVAPLTGNTSWRTQTVKKDGTFNLTPGTLTDGVEIERYEFYIGKTKIGETTSSSRSYSFLNGLRQSHDKLLRDNKYTITVKPIYKAKSAKVEFLSESKAAIAFSGDAKGGTGFKVGDKLDLTQIDKVTFTAQCPGKDKIKVKNVQVLEEYTPTGRKSIWNLWGLIKAKAAERVVETLTPAKDAEALSFKKTYDIDKAALKFRVNYRDLTLTYEYTPEEATAANANAGFVAVYDQADMANPVGVSSVDSPLSLSGRLAMMNNTYVSRTTFGEGQEHYTVDTPNGPISFTTRTLWTVWDPVAGKNITTTGNSYIHNMATADDVVNYHFKAVQDDETPAGVKGKVYIEEKPLFSTTENVTSKAATGVKIDVGGYNTTTDQEGTYTIEPHFNKGEYVAAYLNYGTLAMMDTVATSRDTVKDFHIPVSTSEKLRVGQSTLTKMVDSGDKDMHNETIYNPKTVDTMMLEDADYTLNIVADHEASVTPDKVVYRVYDKKGREKEDFARTVKFSDNNAVLTVNPMRFSPTKDGSDSGKPLEVGDSITATLYDTRGVAYFEHQTSIIVGKKLEGVYTFGRMGEQATADNAFLKAIDGLAVGLDFAIDSAASNAGQFTDETNTTHQLMFIGFGNGFGNQGDNAEREVYQTMKNTIEAIDKVNASDINVSKQDSISVFGNGAWSLDLNMGIIMDTVMQTEGDRKGEFMFSDYLIIANFNAVVNKEWTVGISAVQLSFDLTFKAGDSNEGTSGVGVKWRFYDDSEQKQYIGSTDAVALFEAGLEDEGVISLNPTIAGGVSATLAGLIGVKGSLQVSVQNHVTHDTKKADGNQWNDYGSVILTPTVSLVVLKIPIPVWTENWTHKWSTDEENPAQAMALAANVMSDSLNPASVLYTPTKGAKAQDYSYTENGGAWNGGGAAPTNLLSLFAAEPKSAESVKESVVQTGFLSDSDIAVQDLGGGKYLAVFLNAVPGRDNENKMGAYYSVYEGGAWSSPEMLDDDDDGTEDQLPTISPAGSKGYLVMWSDASRTFEKSDTMSSRLNSFDLMGRFYQDGKMGETMPITHTDKVDDPKAEADNVADTDPHVTYFKSADGTEHMKVYYTKSEYEVTSETEGEVVGDLLNPYQVIAVRNYDFEKDDWSDTYSDKLKEQMKEDWKSKDPNLTEEKLEEKFKDYQTIWYGQETLNLAPSVDIQEQLDEDGYWAAGTTAAPVEANMSQTIVKDGDALSYNDLSLFAYSLDRGGLGQGTFDQSLYLQIYNGNEDDYHHPIKITNEAAEISDIQLVRTNAYVTSGQSAQEETWLYWKEQTQTKDAEGEVSTQTAVRRLNVTALVGTPGNLEVGRTQDGREYYYIVKDADKGNYIPPETLVATSSSEQADDPADYTSISDFKVKSSSDRRYNYLAWTQFVGKDTEDGVKQELQLFVMREDTKTGEHSAPVQVTEKEDQYLSAFDFAVTKDGSIDVLTQREFLKAGKETAGEGADAQTTTVWSPDPATSELAFLRITPSKAFTIDKPQQGSTFTDEDGSKLVTVDTAIRNESFEGVKDVTVEAVDKSGKTVWSSNEKVVTYATQEVKGEDGGVTLEESEVQTKTGASDVRGGERRDISMQLPLADDGTYDVAVRVKSGDTVIAEQEVKGTVAPQLLAENFAVSLVERNKVELSANITNADGALDSAERTVTYGYLDADGKKVPLGTKKIDSLAPGEAAEFAAEADVDFSTFTSTKNEDGSLTDSREFYLDVDVDGFTTATNVFELTATAEQVALMEGASNLSATLATYDEDGALEPVEKLKADDGGYLALTVDGKIAQNEDDYTNRFKVVWDAVDTDVATVTEDGTVKAHKDGTVKLTAKVMPIDTQAIVGEGGLRATVDNYHSLPSSLIKQVDVTLAVGEGEGPVTPGRPGENDGTGQTGQTNKPGKPSKGKLPQTGDTFNIAYVLILVVLGAGLVAVGIKRFKK